MTLKELDVPVIALSQLNRGVERRADRRPRLADLRRVTGIEQTADTVLFIYRDRMYDRSADEHAAEIIIAKQGNAPLGKIDLRFVGANTKFENLPRAECA